MIDFQTFIIDINRPRFAILRFDLITILFVFLYGRSSIWIDEFINFIQCYKITSKFILRIKCV